jgi:hypothetical protein
LKLNKTKDLSFGLELKTRSKSLVKAKLIITTFTLNLVGLARILTLKIEKVTITHLMSVLIDGRGTLVGQVI